MMTMAPAFGRGRSTGGSDRRECRGGKDSSSNNSEKFHGVSLHVFRPPARPNAYHVHAVP